MDRDRVEPWERDTPRLATGVQHQTERLRALGNGVVVQVAGHIGRILRDLAVPAAHHEVAA
ncbi:hypothetical protein [Pseudofrankia sp. DC12]|uniref:hypothetical protein n=1 Tax=Pseudofrankia sp. DC12 TaxID=683315 RepID=UPI0005F862BA|nr:hypothetical protein [Pseudofrankia sp. DC12]